MNSHRRRLPLLWVGWILIVAAGAGAGYFVTKNQIGQNVPPAATATSTAAPSGVLSSPAPTQFPTLVPGFLQLNEPTDPSPLPNAGDAAPDFTLETLRGTGRVVLSQLRGKAVLVNFWASNCPPCKAEAPLLEKQYAGGQDKSLVVLGVVPGDEDTRDAALAFAASYGLSYPLLWDGLNQVTRQYGVIGLPTSVMVLPDGKIDRVIIGAVTADDLSAFIRRAAPAQ